MIVKMIQDLKKRMDKMQMFTKDIEELKNNNTNKKKQMNNTLEAISNRIIEAEWISNLEYRMVEITATKQNIEKRMRKKKLRQPKRPLEQH